MVLMAAHIHDKKGDLPKQHSNGDVEQQHGDPGVARVRMLLRRQAGLRTSALSFGKVEFDLNSRTFSAGGVPLDIPARELGLLEILFMRAGKVVSKEAIMQSLAAFDDDLSANAIEQYVSRLRKRLAPHELTVRTARGIGYYLDKAAPA